MFYIIYTQCIHNAIFSYIFQHFHEWLCIFWLKTILKLYIYLSFESVWICLNHRLNLTFENVRTLLWLTIRNILFARSDSIYADVDENLALNFPPVVARLARISVLVRFELRSHKTSVRSSDKTVARINKTNQRYFRLARIVITIDIRALPTTNNCASDFARLVQPRSTMERSKNLLAHLVQYLKNPSKTNCATQWRFHWVLKNFFYIFLKAYNSAGEKIQAWTE